VSGLLLIGTVPDSGVPVCFGPVGLRSETVEVGARRQPVGRGTPAMMAAAALACRHLGLPAPWGLWVGDEGTGAGSRRLYEYLLREIGSLEAKVFVFHYLMPDVLYHNRILFALEERDKRPLLIADAGFMYVAKMSGFAASYDLFTPDRGELAFLADEAAPHPFYTRGFLFASEGSAPELARRAWEHGNAARTLLVKGACDVVCHEGRMQAEVSEPAVEALEAIGGTGDTLTGIVGALLHAGLEVAEAARRGARINRLAGLAAAPDPGTQIERIVRCIPQALEQADQGPELAGK
jgi:hypothetical protein